MDTLEQEEKKAAKRAMPAAKFIMFISVLMVIASFSVKNMHAVKVNYYNTKIELMSLETPLFNVIAASMIAGFFLAWFFGFLNQFQLQWKNRSLSNKVKALSKKAGEFHPGV